jgi:hypothetical protein
MAFPRGVGIALAVLLARLHASAQPAVSHIFPPAGQAGTTTTVTAIGKFNSWPPTVWGDAPGVTFKPTTNSGRFEVAIASDAAPGPRLVRFVESNGSSAPRFFIVSRDPELLEAEPNDQFARPQRIEKLPASISGRLEKPGDVDSFAVTLRGGQTLTASLEAYTLMSPFDGLLRVVDTNGTQLAFNHDGATLDPRLVWEAPHNGTFVVQVMGFVYPATAAVQLTGSDSCVYRLHLAVGDGRPPFPPCALPSVTETETNDLPASAQQLTGPAAVNGVIGRAGDEDRFAFTADKQKSYELTVVAARAGSPLDAWLKIESAGGRELARNDDAEGSRDPRLTWTAPSNGVFVVAIGELTHRGGRDFAYRLEITEAAPAVTATVADHFFSLQPGKTNGVKVALKRLNGFKPGLKLEAEGLPDDVRADAVDLGEKAGDATLVLRADADAKPANQPFRLILRETGTGIAHAVRHFLTSSGENNGVPQGYSTLVVDSTDQLWLTISPDPPAAKPKKKK